MANIIKNGAELLAELLKQHASEQVTYERTDLGTVDVPATFGSKLLRTHDEFGGIKLEWTDLDFIIPAADLVIAGQQIEPILGDFVYVTQGLESPVYQQYQVFPFGHEAPWRWSDPFLINYRIHTKLIGNVAPNTNKGIIFFGYAAADVIGSADIQALAFSHFVDNPLGIYDFIGQDATARYPYIAYPATMEDLTLIVDLGFGYGYGASLELAGVAENPAYSQATLSGQPYARVPVILDQFNVVDYHVFRGKFITAGDLTYEVV